MTLRTIARFCVIVFLFCALDRSIVFGESHPASSAGVLTDFVDFWAASRLLINGGNPFSPAEVLKLQQSVGYREPKPLLMWNPPWTLSFVLPIGVMDYELSQFLWLLIHIFFILLSAKKLWAIYSQTERQSYLPWIAAFTFAPTLMVLIIGQITPFILLGIVAFLHFERKNQLFLAGVTTTMLSIKPHLIYLFWIGLILWVWNQRRWRVAYGAIVAGLIVAIIPAMFDPAVHHQFIEMYRFPGRSTPFELPAPSIGSFLTLYVPHGNLPIQFLPPLLGTLWFLWHWQKYKENWNWSEQVPMMMLVSLTLSPYAWTYDQVILLPAVIHGFVIGKRQSFSWHQFGLGLLYIGVNGCYFVAKLFVTTDSYYFWLAPAFLSIYVGVNAVSRSTTPTTSYGVT
jgi:hypothetical protein